MVGHKEFWKGKRRRKTNDVKELNPRYVELIPPSRKRQQKVQIWFGSYSCTAVDTPKVPSRRGPNYEKSENVVLSKQNTESALRQVQFILLFEVLAIMGDLLTIVPCGCRVSHQHLDTIGFHYSF